jgi:hypothetical protein
LVSPWRGRRAARRPWCEGRRSTGSVQEEGRKGKGGAWSGGLARPAGPDWSARPDGRWAGGKKKENRNLYRN